MSEDDPKTYHFMRKIGADSRLKKNHWESTVVISWKDLEYLPTSLDHGTQPFQNPPEVISRANLPPLQTR